MDISFILLSWNSEKFIEKSLNSILVDLKKSVSFFTFEIFIVDNGSQDKTIQILASFQKKYPGIVKPIFLEKNMGTTFSRNLALKNSLGNFIVVMDSDVEIEKGTTEGLITFLQSSPSVGIVVPRLNYPNGKLQKSTDVFPTILTKIYRYFFLRKIEKKEAEVVSDNIQDVDYAISAMWVIPRNVLVKVGYLDENIFYAPEDVDYCLRVKKAGYKIIYNSEVKAVHYTQEISRGIKVNYFTFLHIWGLFYYFTKHRCWFKRPAI